ncbi:MAG: serine/threonine protein kinase [Acidobacteriia bacterium]|nr:serine/threonine protein kinase [Terriglobia bacterium]
MTDPPSGPPPGSGGGASHSDPDQEQLLANAVADFLDRRARGEAIDADSYCRLHPDLAALRNEIDTLDRLEGLLEAPRPGSADGAALPEKLSGHKILSEIGSGGMGRVLLGQDEALGRTVAIKVLNTRYLNNSLVRTRFMQEARAMARLSHPNIVHIYNLGQPDEIPHFVMEYVEGASLTEAARALTLEQKVELMHKVVAAVEFLHQHQVVHRDLKPGNILVGPDLEPKVLDFGLAQQSDDSRRLTLAGEIMGTPDYFSPEQACANQSLDARSDIFSLGIILYQLLTGMLPFRAQSLTDQVRMICEQDPVLPRRINANLPGELQNVCLKAMEKNPGDRYQTAREMADDLARYLAREPVLASPTSYTRIMAGKIEQHLRDLEGWKQDHILSLYEFDTFRKLYDRLVDREDAWILEVRRLSLSQVTLYLGAWILVVGAMLVVLFRYDHLSDTSAVLLAAAAAAPTAWIGIRCWKQGQFRVAVAYLLAFCFLLPVTMLIAMNRWDLWTGFSHGKKTLELIAQFSLTQRPTNAQLWWAVCLSLPAYLWLRRFTRASVFSLVFAVMGALLPLITLLRQGALDWFRDDPSKFYLRLIPVALLFFTLAVIIERRSHPDDSRYFYPIAVLFTFAALSGEAAQDTHLTDWLGKVVPKTRGQIEYLFISNALIYLSLQSFSEHFGSAQLRSVAKVYRFVIPGHVLTSLLFLGLSAYGVWQDGDPGMRLEARFFEVLLPLAAGLFVFGSIPKQMKNFFATGLLFLAIGIVRLQYDMFKNHALWPVGLLIAGLLLMYIAVNYTQLKLALTRRLRRSR